MMCEKNIQTRKPTNEKETNNEDGSDASSGPRLRELNEAEGQKDNEDDVVPINQSP